MKSKKKIRFLLSVFISLIMIFSVVQPAMVEADPIIPAAPKDFKADAGITKIALNWGAAAKAAEYDLEVDGKIISTETNTSYVHENLLPGSIHTYRVRTKGESWTSEWSAALKVKTQLITPNEPKNFKITSVSNSSIAMEWKDTLLAASYEIEVDGKVVSNILSTSYQQNNLAPSSKHTFRVRAQNDAGVSNWSECYEVTTFPDAPLSPKNLKASNLNDGNITITWDKVNGAEYYDVFADNKLIENLSKNTFSQNFTLNDKVHIYAVRAKNSGGVSEWSQEISIKYSAPKPYLNIKSMIPSVPTNVRTNSALDSIKVTWNLVKNAESYDIEADGHIITGITRNEYTLSGISQGTVHTFRVRAKNKNGISGWSSLANNKTTLKSPAIPTNFNANAVSYDCIVIAWDMVNGATDYELEVDGKIIEISINIKYIHTQLTENSNHKYRIRSKNAAGYSKWSETISTTTLSDTTKTKEIPTNNIPDNPVITVNNVEQTPDNPVTNRNKVEQTSENQVTTEINVQQASDNPITTGNNLAQTSDNPVKTENDIPKAPDIPLTSVKNEIEVTQDLSQTRTVKSIAVSRIYSSETDIQAPTAPSNLSVTSTTAASIGLSWTASTDDVGVTEYDIYSGTQLIGTTTGEITCTATCLTPGTNYSFTVKAKDAANNISPESNLLSVSTVSSLTVPVNINTTAANNSVNISWDSATGATGYDIEVDGVIIDNGINTTYNHSGLTTNSQHTYRVRAKDNTNTTEWSSLITVTTLLDTPVNVNGASTDNSIGLIWSQVTGATGYDVEADGTIVDNGSSTSFTHSELVQGSQHTYRVRAKNSSVNSDWSNLLTMTAVLATSTISSNTVLNENVIYGALTISGGTFDLNGHNVTIVGNLNQSGGTFNGNSGLLNVSVNYSQNGGTLNVNSGRINISGNYSLSNSALLMMTNSGDYIYVGGNFAASQYTNETNKLTSGILEVKGNFTQNNLFSYNFTASGDNVVVLSGNNIQTVYFRYPDYSCFNMLDTSKSAGVIFSTPIKLLKLGGITNLDKAGSLTLVSSSIIMDEDYTLNLNLTIGSGMQVDLNGFTLNVINGLIQKDGTINVSGGSLNVTNGFIMSGGTLIVNSGEVNITGSLTQSGGTLNGNSGLLNISENYSQNGGTLNVNSGRINISGNYSLSNSALLMMMNFGDYIYVDENFAASQYTNETNKLTSGVLEVKGNFTQNGPCSYSFAASGDNVVVLSGNNIQTVYFQAPGYSGFNMLDTSRSAGVTFTSAISLLKLDGKTNLDKVTSMTLKNYSFKLNKDYILNLNLKIDYGMQMDLNGFTLTIEKGFDQLNGTLNINGGYLNIKNGFRQSGGILNVNSGILNVSGDYIINTYGLLNMTNENDYVCVDGNFSATQYNDESNYLTAGILEIKGDFYQSCAFPNFKATGNHIIILSGSNVQNVKMVWPEICNFNILITTKPLFTGYVFNAMPIWNYLIENYKVDTNFGMPSQDVNQSEDGAYGPTGNFSKSFADLTCGSDNSEPMYLRTYNSRDSRTDTAFGRGWSFSYECSVKDYGNGVQTKVVRLPDGSTGTFKINTNGTFTPMDSRNQLVKQGDGSYILTAKDQTTYGFNSGGYLVWIKDRNGNITSVTVNGSGKVTEIIDSSGRSCSVSYNASGYIQSISDQAGRTVRYEYENNLLVRVFDPMSHVKTYSYDGSGYLIEIRAEDNSLVEFIAYNHQDGLKKDKVDHTIDQYGNVNTYSYDIVHLKTTITDSNGRQTVQCFDNSFAVISSTDAEGKTTYYEYYKDSAGVNSFSEQKTVTDRNGGVTTYTRDSIGNVTRETHPDGTFKEFLFDSKNNMIQEKDENGKYIFYVYDSNGIRLMKVARPLNGTDIYSETADQSKFAITQFVYYSDSESQQLGYNKKGLLKYIIDSLGNTENTYTYDAYGNVVTLTDAENNTTSFEYNSIGWKTKVTTPMGYVTQYFYDNDGNLEKTILNNNIITRIVYDTLGRQIEVISANLYDPSKDDIINHNYIDNCGTRYIYYSNGKIHTVTDSENNTTAYTYDIYGNVITEAKPNGAVYRYQYDAMNRVTKIYFKENANAQEILLQEYSYTILGTGRTKKTEIKYLNSTETAQTVTTMDYAGRLLSQQNPDGTIISKVYNANGTLYSSADAKGNVTYYVYDGLNRLTGIWSPVETVNGSIYYSYNGIEYDKSGRKVKETVGKDKVTKYTVPTSCIVINYDYYLNDKLKTQTDSAGRRIDYTYDRDGSVTSQIVKVNDSISRTTEYVNNEFGKPVTEKLHVAAGDIYGHDFNDTTDVILTTSYTYDKEGNVLTVTEPDGITKTYVYDKLGRLLSTSEPGRDEYGNNVTIVTSQTYNWEGKVTSRTDANNNVTTYVYDARGFLIKEIDAKGNTTAYYYDYAGRRIAEASANNYDGTKELNNLNRTEYIYDLMGRVKAKLIIYFDTVTNQWITITSKAFQYDDNGNVIKELDAAGYESGTGSTLDEKISTGYGTVFTYDMANQLITVLDPDSQDRCLPYSKKYTYDGAGRKITETDGKGKVTTYYYDDAGNITSTTVKRLAYETEVIVKSATYDFTGNMISATDGNGYITTYEYNAFGKVKRVTCPGDSTIDAYYIIFQYDALGELVKKQDSLGVTDLYTFDNQGRETSHVQQKADGTEAIAASTKYDVNGNKRYVTDANGVVTEYTYDSLNKLITSSVYLTNSLGQQVKHTTTYTYDKNGNLVTTTDWLGNTITSVYDLLYRLIRKIDQNNKTIQTLEYNTNGTQ